MEKLGGEAIFPQSFEWRSLYGNNDARMLIPHLRAHVKGVEVECPHVPLPFLTKKTALTEASKKTYITPTF